jgi:hypothetical protein
MAVVVTAALATLLYFPFRWDPPAVVRNGVVRTSTGALHFGTHNAARTPEPPAWVPAVVRTGQFDVSLEVNPSRTRNVGPVPVLILARSPNQTDLMVGQSGSGLKLWLRRSGSNANGDPALAVDAVFAPRHWVRIRVGISGSLLRVLVDGRPRLERNLSAGSLRTWDEKARISLGNELYGNGDWQGEIRKALVTTPAGAIDYVTPGAVTVPARYWTGVEHWQPSTPLRLQDVAVDLVHLVAFAALGAVVLLSARRPRLPAVVFRAYGVAVVLLAGKLFFQDRHVALADFLTAAVGVTLGVTLARRAGGTCLRALPVVESGRSR